MTYTPDTTPATDNARAWLERVYPERDMVVEHTDACDRVSLGDECVGGCPVSMA